MNGYLLDTSACLVLALEVESDAATRRLQASLGGARCFLSQVNAIEIAIKHSIGKLPLPPPFTTSFGHAFNQMASEFEADVLGVEMRHIELLARLPLLHRDPFDRLIIAQALADDLTVITRDRSFALYPGLDVFEI